LFVVELVDTCQSFSLTRCHSANQGVCCIYGSSDFYHIYETPLLDPVVNSVSQIHRQPVSLRSFQLRSGEPSGLYLRVSYPAFVVNVRAACPADVVLLDVTTVIKEGAVNYNSAVLFLKRVCCCN
jgi:hypothetical protein